MMLLGKDIISDYDVSTQLTGEPTLETLENSIFRIEFQLFVKLDNFSKDAVGIGSNIFQSKGKLFFGSV